MTSQSSNRARPASRQCCSAASSAGTTRRVELAIHTIPGDAMSILSEGIQIIDDDGNKRPDVDPFSFAINRHVWTVEELRYKFNEFLNHSARHLITDHRQTVLMKRAIDTWLPHIARSASRADNDAPWSDVDVVIWTENIGSHSDIARGQFPRTVRVPGPGEPGISDDNKSNIRWNTKAYVIDREAAYHAFWGAAPAAYLGALIAVAIGGGLIGAAIWAITLAIILKTHSDYREVAIHEFGHVLGLGHSPRKSSIMYPVDQDGKWSLGEHDTRAIRSLYPERLVAREPSDPGRPQAHTVGLFTDTAGTESRVLDLLGPRRDVIAFTVLGFQDSLTNFDDDNTVAAEVFAIGGRDDLDEATEIHSQFQETTAERQSQLSHEYDALDADDRTLFSEHRERHPMRLTLTTDDINREPHNATALYSGYAIARGNTVQFRALSFHPGDHLLFATGIVIARPDAPVDGLYIVAPPPPPPPPPPNAHLDLEMEPDIQVPPPPPLGFTPAPPPPGPQIVAELPPPGPQLLGVSPIPPPPPVAPGDLGPSAGRRSECCVPESASAGRRPPDTRTNARALSRTRPTFGFVQHSNEDRIALLPPPTSQRRSPESTTPEVDPHERPPRGRPS